MKIGKICIYVISKYANYGTKHQSTIFKCETRFKTEAEVWREKSKKLQVKDKLPAIFVAQEKKSSKIEVDTSLAL